MKSLSKKLRYVIATLMLFALAMIGVACGANGYELHIDAPTEIQAELGTYIVPKYDVVNEHGTVMAGYEVTLFSVTDPDGNSVDKTNNRIEITKAGIYELEYTANNKKVPNVTVKVDFADRTPPVITTYLDNYPDLFLSGHSYSIPTYSVDDAQASREMKMYHKSPSGERKEIEYEGLYFTAEENEGEYQFVFTAEDTVGNKTEICHVVPVDGPATPVKDRIVYFNEPFGAREIKLLDADTGAMTAEYSTEIAYDGESGSTLVSVNEQTNYAFIEIRYPAIENLSNYDSFVWRVYNPNEYALQFGLAWTAYQTLQPKTWTEFRLPTSYFRNHGSDALQTPNYVPVYEDSISGLTFVIMNERWAQNGDVAEGTKIYLSALDAYRAEGNDLRITGGIYDCVYDQTDYELDDYKIVNRAGVTVYDASVNLYSAIAPDGTQATVENGKLTFDQEGIYTLVYKGEYSGADYGKTIDDLTVKIVNGGSLANAEKGEEIDGCAVYADRKYGIKQIASTKNVAVQIDEETKFGTESASMKVTLISDGVGDVVFNTESVVNPENYEAIQFRVHTKNNNIFRIWVTYGENSEYLGADSVTCFPEGDDWVTVVCYLKDVDRSKLGIHFFNTYSTGSVIPADTEIFVSNICFVDGGYSNLPQNSEMNLITENNTHTVPKSVMGRNNVAVPITDVSVTHNGSEVTLTENSFTMTESGVYTVTYTLNAKEYSYTITVTAEVEDVVLVYDPNVTTYTVSDQLTVTSVKLNGADVARDGNVITLGDAGEYEVTATVADEEVTFKITYYKPQSIQENTAVYANSFGTHQIKETRNLTVTAENDAVKGSVLKLTVSAAGKDAVVLFANKSLTKDYDYVSFWVKTEGVALAGITQKTTDPFGSHVAAVDGTWKKVSFHFLSQSQTWWYDGDAVLGLYLFNGYGSETLDEGACVYITDIVFEQGNAQLENVANYNMATSGAEYTLPATATDTHGVDKEGGHVATIDAPITITRVEKDGTSLTVTDGKVTFTGAGVYTVTYKAYNTEYSYTITVTAEVEDVVLVYDPNVTTYTVSGQFTVTSVKLNGADVARDGNVITLGDAGEYEVTATVADEDVTFKITYYKPQTVGNDIAVYAEDFAKKQVKTLNNITLEGATDSEKGNVLKITVVNDSTYTGTGSGVIFNTTASLTGYDYVSFDIKSSVADMYVAFTNNGAQNWSDHFAYIGTTEWKRISFALNVTTTWYTDNGEFGLCFFTNMGEGVLSAGTVFEITNIVFETGNAQIGNVEKYNVATDGTEYVFPTSVTDTHIRYWAGNNAPVACGVKLTKVMKDGAEVALNEGGLSMNVAPGTYTVYYQAIHDNTFLFNAEYSYTVTVIDTPIEDETCYYSGNETYTLPTSANGKELTVSGVVCDGQNVAIESGAFSLTAGTPTTANDTNTYLYTVSYTVAGDETVHSYTVTYHKPTSVTDSRATYLDTGYGLNYQISAENAELSQCDITHSNGNLGSKGVKIVIQETGTFTLTFNNVVTGTEGYFIFSVTHPDGTDVRFLLNNDWGKAFVQADVSSPDATWCGGGGNIWLSVSGTDMSSFTLNFVGSYAAGTELIITAMYRA